MAAHLTILSTWLDAVIDQLASHGLDPTRLTTGLGNAGSARLAATRHVGLVQGRRLWQRAARLSGDPLLGVKVGMGLPMQALSATGLLMMHSGSLRQALVHAERYQQLVSDSGHIGLHPIPGGLELRYDVTPCHVAMHPIQVDSLFAGLLTFLGRCSTRDIAPEQVDLIAPDRRLSERYTALFGCPVALGADRVRIRYAERALDQPFLGSDPTLLALIRTQADALLRARNSATSVEAGVRAALSQRGFAAVTFDDVARRLAIAPRTLQRRLGRNGTPFRRLLEAARMDEALFLLTEGTLSLPEIASQLGYAEPSSFWHAVKARWGATPRALRDRRPPSSADDPPPSPP